MMPRRTVEAVEARMSNSSNAVEEDYDFDFSETDTIQRVNGLDNQPDYKDYL